MADKRQIRRWTETIEDARQAEELAQEHPTSATIAAAEQARREELQARRDCRGLSYSPRSRRRPSSRGVKSSG